MARITLILTVCVALAACGPSPRAKRNEQAISIQQLLAESGFVERMLDTPGKAAEARDLPQRQVISQGPGNTGHYIYVDVALCGCIYSGDADAYQRYNQRLAERQARSDSYKVIRPVGRYD